MLIVNAFVDDVSVCFDNADVNETVIVHDLNLDRLREIRENIPISTQRHPDIPSLLSQV